MTEARGHLHRRSFLKGVAALGGLVAARPLGAIAGLPLGGSEAVGAGRMSPLQADDLFLVSTDLHNHSLISGDAAGDPYGALAQMRSRGIDVACLTEHAISGKGHGELTCPGHQQGGCHTVEGINETDWETMRQIADAGYAPGQFVSFRGYEWSTPTVGHLNVYFSREFTDALREHALFTPAAAAEIDRVAPVPSEIVDNFEKAPDIATMRFFWKWLASSPDREIFGGGNDGIACFNHPNEFGTFESFRYDAGAAPYVVSIEALNADRDFFWFGLDKGRPNPLNACLNAGWRVGFTGVSDEHSTAYGRAGMARGGLWVSALTRAAVRDALVARRSFATFRAGLRLCATANGAPMGSTLAHSSGPVAIAVDVDGGSSWAGTPLSVEVVRPGATAAALAHVEPIVAGTPKTFTVNVDRAAGDWLFLRIADASRDEHPLATPPWTSYGGALAYASPWFLTS